MHIQKKRSIQRFHVYRRNVPEDKNNVPFYVKHGFSVMENGAASKADIRNPLSLLAHERSRFATCQWELLTPTDISIPLTHRLVLYALEAGECLFCVQICNYHDMK